MSVLNELVLDAFARVIEDVREVLNGLESTTCSGGRTRPRIRSGG